jgi:cell division transport system permease protein
MALPYPFRLAVQGMLREKWVNLVSILTIAAGLLLTTVIVLTVYNIDLAAKKLPEKFSMMVYLKDDLSQEQTKSILYDIKNDDSVKSVSYIPKDKALNELKSTFKDIAYVLDGLEENPLFDSVEVKLQSEAVGPETAKELTAKFHKIKGIEEIEYGEKFLSSIHSLKIGIRNIGFLFVVIMSVGMIFVCYSTVKILFYRKNKEIETHKLLGATKGFIRAPFMIEGAVVGLFSGVLSLVGILSLYYVIIYKLSFAIPLFKTIVFPINMSFFLPLIGLFIGMTGAFLAVGRLKY